MKNILKCFSLFFLLTSILSAKTSITTEGNIDINRLTKFITIITKTTITRDNDLIITVNQLDILYDNLNNLQKNLANQNLHNFKKITGKNGVEIKTKKGLMKGDTYIYDVDKAIMVITSNKKPSTYVDDKMSVRVLERFELQEKENIIVLRGTPLITFKKDTKQTFSANLISGKLTKNRTDVEYMEAFDNVRVTHSDGTEIKGDYAYYVKNDNLLTIEENLSISGPKGLINACKIILNVESGESKIIPCGNKKGISGRIE